MVVLIISVFVLLAWLLWLTLASGSLRQMNAGARLFQQKRYPEAEAHFQQLLTHRLPLSVEADTRRRLADTLEILGHTEEATAERERASIVAMNSKHDPMALATQGDLLKVRHQYDEACELYDRALTLVPPVASAGRALIMVKLAIAHHMAGRSAETLRWAEAALVSSPAKDIRRVMERMAGVASADQGDLEGAEGHYLRALELAEAGGKPEEAAQCLALLASLQHKRGYFEEAISTARRARELARSFARTEIAVEAECLRDMGRFDEARAVMRLHFDGPYFDKPSVERKMQALGELRMAWIESRAECPDAAWNHLETARAGLKAVTSANIWPPPAQGGEEKLVLWCDATAVNILAQQGRNPEARRLRDSIESRLPPFAADNATLRGTYGHLARALLRMGDLAECRDYCRRYKNCLPPPSVLPTIHYLLGEVALRLSETDAACEEFRQAVAPGINSLDAQRAQARLDEMGDH